MVTVDAGVSSSVRPSGGAALSASIPMRPLSALEKSVEAAALQVVQQYLLGEMDYVEDAAGEQKKEGGDEGSSQDPVTV